ncbi:TetR/AcrR family transcriptional regulator [Paenibacillus sp. YPG26]|uniref:TetR/AcrR family transcriptional regulator n=1 Tax=Paenibacillus sp. YPG26 TaxID=2878915 RepID=UPI00203D9E52|nr:TetR/AcrR family transcriptional regulator [Paenibacillus sp. YPG26]USB33958.1 TetR/AcrR family transcriptional regulator [Paenibacillus sp. YPG26]
MPPVVSEDYKMQKKQDILSSALICFARKGYQQATMDDIVEQSGLSKGAIYNYFKSKDEIYFEAVNENTSSLQHAVQEQLQQLPASIDKVSFLFDTYLSNTHQDQAEMALFQVYYEFRLQSCRDEKIASFLKKRRQDLFINLIRDIITDGQGRGEIRTELDATVLAHTFWGLIDGASICVVTDPDYPYEAALSQMKQMFLAYIS